MLSVSAGVGTLTVTVFPATMPQFVRDSFCWYGPVGLFLETVIPGPLLESGFDGRGNQRCRAVARIAPSTTTRSGVTSLGPLACADRDHLDRRTPVRGQRKA